MTINVFVKSNPKGEAKGRYRCEVTDAGLVLSQKKSPDIVIPIGTAARYEGKSKFTVTLPDFELEIAIQKFGSYHFRMAKDLADYVNGDRPAPSLSDYGIEWYFYVLAVLPIGIPFITLGGAIPGALGGGLAAANLGIAQNEDWPAWVRIVAMLGVSVAAYALLFVLLATVWRA